MNFYRNINLYLFFTAALIVTSSFIVRNPNKLPGSTITIEFKHFVDKELLVLDTISYKNDLGQSYTISKFKYYIGNIILTADDKSEFAIPGFHLINEEDDISKSIKHVNVPNKHFISLSFIIGVDSIHNCSGIQSGDLDPVKGMFWAWNTGYIFLKLEGNSPVSASPGNTLEYHIGGFHKPNCIRNVSLPLLNYHLNKVENDNHIISIKTDIAEIFRKPTQIDFSKLPIIADFQHANTMADNYQDIFTILECR